MRTKLKYVMFNDKTFILIPLTMSHDDVAMKEQVRSAGFIQILDEYEENQWGEKYLKVYCYGESTSLGKKANSEDDSIIINSALRLN